jgi:hypothetical protein
MVAPARSLRERCLDTARGCPGSASALTRSHHTAPARPMTQPPRFRSSRGLSGQPVNSHTDTYLDIPPSAKCASVAHADARWSLVFGGGGATHRWTAAAKRIRAALPNWRAGVSAGEYEVRSTEYDLRGRKSQAGTGPRKTRAIAGETVMRCQVAFVPCDGSSRCSAGPVSADRRLATNRGATESPVPRLDLRATA